VTESTRRRRRAASVQWSEGSGLAHRRSLPGVLENGQFLDAPAWRQCIDFVRSRLNRRIAEPTARSGPPHPSRWPVKSTISLVLKVASDVIDGAIRWLLKLRSI
jgi:hypothetical protein